MEDKLNKEKAIEAEKEESKAQVDKDDGDVKSSA
jgi:hypothetical protein